jgi:hypothetical protein
MSTQIAPLPVGLSTGIALASGPAASAATSTAQETTKGGHRSKQAPATEHHLGRKPDDHLCTCGRLREECVRDRVRALWA